MKRMYFFVLIAFMSTTIFAQTTWSIDENHSQVSFAITHFGIAEITGQFREYDATIQTQGNDFSNAEFNVEIDVSSVDTGVQKRDDHLRSEDFFNAEQHPKMTFRSTSVEKVGDDRYKVTGNLTLNGVTKLVTLDLWHRGTITHPQNNKEIAGFQVTGSIDRSDFNFGSGFREPMLGDEVRIKVDGEFSKES